MMKRRRPGERPAEPSRYGDTLNDVQRQRLRLFFACCLAGFLVIGVRLHFVHLIPNEALDTEDAKHIGKTILKAPRGEIYDRNATLKLATNRMVPSLWVDAAALEDTAAFAHSVAPRVGRDPEELLQEINATTSSGNRYKFRWVKRWITEDDEIAAVKELEKQWPKALHVEEESIRHYPQRGAASHLLGFVNRNGDACEGLELFFDDHLRSETGMYRARADTDRVLLESHLLDFTPPKTGDSVQLTIDVNMQLMMERTLDARLEACNASQGMGVLMNPKTGAIYAMATRPAFDPNYYDQYEVEQWRNRAITDYFEPGSAFKIVGAAAAIEEGLITPNTLIDCENGGFNPYGHRISDYHPLGVEPFSKCFEESSNVAIIKVAKMLGPERFNNWMHAFGFGATTSRDFPRGAEIKGRLRERDEWNRLSMGSLPMGQEIGVTMLQMARSFAVVANGGTLVEPYFIERAIGNDGSITYQHTAPEPPRVISEETSAIMRDLCHRVVLHGTGDDAAIDEYSVGGKTGTAQMLAKSGRGYSKDRYTTVFAGFAPVSDPRVVCVIVVKEPMIRLHYGGYVCGPVFRDVVSDALIRLNVPSDQEVDEDVKVVTAAVVEKDRSDGDAVTARLSEDEILALELAMEDQLESLDPLELTRTNGDVVEGTPLIPDLMGLSKRQAYEKLRVLGIPWDPRGAGWVTYQSPPAGTPVSAVQLCSLEFSRTKVELTDDPS